MNPENKKFLLAMIDKFPVSVTTLDDTVMYHIMLPDNRALSICADITIMDSAQTIIYYTVYVGDDLLEEATIDTSEKQIDPVAKDILHIMRACSTKVMAQEAHLAYSKYMIHNIPNPKIYS